LTTSKQLRDRDIELAAKARIKRCKTVSDCIKMGRSLERIYRAGAVSDSVYQRLDIKLLDHRIRIEHELEDEDDE